MKNNTLNPYTINPYTLKPWNTFGIEQNANQIVCINNAKQLLDVWRKVSRKGEPVLILGEGSNVLFLDDFAGTVIINRIMGIKVIEKVNSCHLHIGAGENWHQLVQFTLENGMGGLENLALIPGCVGSSPIQNIGAYGIELQSVCEYVDCIELTTGKIYRINAEQCQFEYRNSIFKHEYQNRYVIIAIGICLAKRWKPVLTHNTLTYLDPEIVTPLDIFEIICQIRIKKFPDPRVQGNAGSFFKNPIINAEIAQNLLIRWPKAPHYPQMDGSIKLAAGWLIEQCQLKGATKGGAALHDRHSLILINQDQATSSDIVQLARLVRQCVGKKFNVWLEPEVRFIGPTGEINAVETIS